MAMYVCMYMEPAYYSTNRLQVQRQMRVTRLSHAPKLRVATCVHATLRV